MSVAAPLNWIENSQEALAHNLAQIRSLTGQSVEIAICVKGNAYGHGLACLTPAIEQNRDVNRASIFSIEEAAVLRDYGFTKPILCMGYVPESQLDALWDLRVEPFIFDLEQARAISETAAKRQEPIHVHIKVDTGMTRLGVLSADLPAFLDEILAMPGLVIAGMATHFASSDAAGDNPQLQSQLALYQAARTTAESRGQHNLCYQASNSAAIVRYPQAHFNLVRPGRMAYGYLPDRHFQQEYAPQLAPLREIISVKSRIIQVKRVPAGTSISYSATYTTKEDSTIAVLPIGYSDGVSRFLGNRADVLVGGMRCPIRGKIAMNAMMVDVSAVLSAQVGDEVVILGSQAGGTISTYEHGVLCNTLPYNVLTAFQAYIPRVLVA